MSNHPKRDQTDSFNVRPDAKVSTNFQTLLAIVSATAVLAGGIVSLKSDASTALQEAHDAKRVALEIRDDLYKLRLQLAQPRDSVSARPTHPTGDIP